VHDWAGHYQRFWTQKLDHVGAVVDREAARERKVPAVRDRIARDEGADPPTRRATRPRR
jgi:hypothetical protein